MLQICSTQHASLYNLLGQLSVRKLRCSEGRWFDAAHGVAAEDLFVVNLVRSGLSSVKIDVGNILFLETGPSMIRFHLKFTTSDLQWLHIVKLQAHVRDIVVRQLLVHGLAKRHQLLFPTLHRHGDVVDVR